MILILLKDEVLVLSPHDQVAAIFTLLKQHLKSKRLSYGVLAKRLNMSESNLKRIFSTRSCGFEQIAQICDAAGASFFSIVNAAAKSELLTYSLPAEAEDFFLNHFECFVFFRRLGGSRVPNEYIETCKIPKQKLEFYLGALERFKLLRRTKAGIELIHTGYLDISRNQNLTNKIKRKWIPWFFERLLQNEGSPNYFIAMGSTGLSSTHRNQLIAELEQLIRRYKEIGYQDQQPGSAEGFESVGFCMGVGPHRIGFFEGYQFDLKDNY